MKLYRTIDHYTEAQKLTAEMSVRQAAQKAGMRCTLGLEFIYLNDKKTKYGDAREIIGKTLQGNRAT